MADKTRFNSTQMKGALGGLLNPASMEENKPEEKRKTTDLFAPRKKEQNPSNTDVAREVIEKIVEDPELKEGLNEDLMEKEGKKKPGRKEKPESKDFEPFCTKVNKTICAKIRIIAEKDNIEIKDIVGLALKRAIDSYEKRNGEITIPKKQKQNVDINDLF